MSTNNIQESLFKTTSVAYSENIAKERGWKIAPKDHPIYSEGVTISFVHNTRTRRASVKQKSDSSNKNIQGGE